MQALVLLAVLVARTGANELLFNINPDEIQQDTAIFNQDPLLAPDGDLIGISSTNGALYSYQGGGVNNYIPGGGYPQAGVAGYPGSGRYPGGTGSRYPVGSGSYPVGSGSYPVGSGSYPVGSGSYPVVGGNPGGFPIVGGGGVGFPVGGHGSHGCPRRYGQCRLYGYRQHPCRYDHDCLSPGHKCCYDECFRYRVCKNIY
ncbi:hypothetical protein OTU49_015176 [Cherax quadricarinatus]|uniref:WAP domain-containing protein n=1 Tax=Cherax quadricarinatus TaxID=27406 RepID=A0AAW0XZM8_CHEQU|nr:uncharacterized protein LOC128685392 [Cherax quadricarinatus]